MDFYSGDISEAGPGNDARLVGEACKGFVEIYLDQGPAIMREWQSHIGLKTEGGVTSRD